MEYKQGGFFKRVAKALIDTEKLKTPVVVKEATEVVQRIEQYKNALNKTADPVEINRIHEQMKLLELGLKGEKSVLFELQNAFLPLHILHDVRIIHNDFKAQIDFVVLTRKFILLIEVKNYYGNILVNEKDEFIRQVYKGNKLVFQEGFYSPVRQVERQAEVFEAYMKEMGAVTRTPIKHVVVFTNNRTVLNTKKASKHVKEKIMRIDGLVKFIKQELEKDSPVKFMDNRMQEMSDYIKASHVELIVDDIDVVEQKLLQETLHEQPANDAPPEMNQVNTSQLEDALKKFRMQIATKQNVKAYHIFTNKTLDELILKQPCTINDLKNIQGFGDVKTKAFGEELVELIRAHQKK
ncbi:NERD domain-containing protein [Lysinibacillus endophyticus]|uniref:NERD domain-containing protein n=1 Tax=Ureibacillus endophyticus TaxID=1978490 RepID=UPI00209CE331|nr:NERD domain-containing protein [Lysinibacillus endophyticus]MCP1145275.1 NERD domain-containing protein [Lysinibacillus endophyticus]